MRMVGMDSLLQENLPCQEQSCSFPTRPKGRDGRGLSVHCKDALEQMNRPRTQDPRTCSIRTRTMLAFLKKTIKATLRGKCLDSVHYGVKMVSSLELKWTEER